MNAATKRASLRWIHLIFGIPIVGYVYSPFEELPNYAPVVRFVFFIVIVLSGFWMWKGYVLRRLISKRSAQHAAAQNRPQLCDFTMTDNLKLNMAFDGHRLAVAELGR